VSDRGELPEIRAMMLYAEINVISRGPDWPAYVAALKEFVADAPALLTIIEEKLKPPPDNPELRKLEARAEKRRRKTEREEADGHASWMKFWKEGAEHPEDVFAPRSFGKHRVEPVACHGSFRRREPRDRLEPTVYRAAFR
jgi:hypothetical protein